MVVSLLNNNFMMWKQIFHHFCLGDPNPECDSAGASQLMPSGSDVTERSDAMESSPHIVTQVCTSQSML